MTIDYRDYKDWKRRSRFIRFYRAKSKCEVCGVVNYSYINKHTRESCTQDEENAIKVVLTVAHLDHDITNNSFFNLKAMCQRCYLRYDAKYHAEARAKKKNKDQLTLKF